MSAKAGYSTGANLLEAIPGIEVQGYFVDFEGIWDAGIASPRPLEGTRRSLTIPYCEASSSSFKYCCHTAAQVWVP
jgi:hypothetical protein